MNLSKRISENIINMSGLPLPVRNIIDEYLKYDRVFNSELIGTTAVIFNEIGNLDERNKRVVCVGSGWGWIKAFWGVGTKTIFPYISSIKRNTSISYIN